MGIGFRLRFLELYSVFEHVTYIHMEGKIVVVIHI